MQLHRQGARLVAACLSLALATPAWAADPPADTAAEPPTEDAWSGDAAEEYRTVVTPTRSSGTEFDVERSVYLRDQERLLELQPTDVSDVLDDVPGVQVQRTNRGAGAPILRGLIGPQNLILIDGVRFNNSTFRTGPNQYLSLIDPMALEAIEVVLGPGSVLYGSDAMGGTINLLTLNAPGAPGPFGLARGRFQSVDLGAEGSIVAGGNGGFVKGWAGGGFRHHGILRTGDGTEAPLSDYDQGDWRAKLDFDLGRGFSVGATYLASRIEDAGRTDSVGKGDVRFTDNADDLVFLDAFYRSRTWLREVRLNLSYHRTNEIERRVSCAVGDEGLVADIDACLRLSDLTITRKRMNEDTVDTVGALALATGSWLDDRLTVTLGSETYKDFVSSSRDDASAPGFSFKAAGRGNFSNDSSYLTTGAFVYAEARPLVVPGVGDLVLSAGTRLSHIEAFAPDVPGVGDVDYANTGVVFSGGARFLLLNRYNFYANFSQGFRAPNLQETTVLGDTGNNFEVPNDALSPEKSNTVEAGVKVYHPWLRVSAAWYYSIVDDVIDREDTTFDGESEVDGKKVVRRVNAAEATYQGVEATFNTGRVVGISMFGNVSWVKGDVTNPDGTSVPARRVPPVQGLGGFRWDSGDDRVAVELFVRWAAEQDRLAPGDTEDLRICEDRSRPGVLRDDCASFDAWASPGVRVHWLPADHLRIDAAIENLIDDRYRVFGSGFDAPGLNASVAATITL